MQFSESPLALVAQDIRNAANITGFAHYGIVIHTPQGDVEVFRLLNIDILNDYVNNYCSETTVSAWVPTGAYKFKILPNISELEVSLQRRHYNPFRPGQLIQDAVRLDRYTAQLIDAIDDPISQEGMTQINATTEDLASHKLVKLQLFDKVMEQFSMRTFGGIYRRSSVGAVIKTALMGESTQADVDAAYAPGGVDMVEPLDATLREHIVIPMRESKSVPEYIHKHCGGVYSAGLSYYYHNDMWYVYPTYDFTRFNESKKQLTIIVVPEKSMPDQEHTFMSEGDALTILVTGEVATSDVSDQTQLQLGNGSRFTDPAAMATDSLTVANNKAVLTAAKSNSEFTTTTRPNGFNKVTTSKNPITSNRLYELSKLAQRNGKLLMVVWQNANPELIIPGMQTKLLHMKGNRVVELRGVITGNEVSVQYTGRTLVAGNYTCTCALRIHLDKDPVE